MKRKIANFSYFIVLLFLTLCVTASAKASNYYMVDNAGLLNENQSAELEDRLKEVSADHSIDIVILTVNDIGEKSPINYACDFYDTNGYGYGSTKDGVILLISMADRDMAMSGTDKGADIFTDSIIDDIMDEIASDLGDADYYDAFSLFVDICDDTANEHAESLKFPFWKYVIIALFLGFVIAFVATAVMKGKLKSVRPVHGAAGYIKKGSFKLTESRDLFLYSTVTRTARPKNNSSGGGGSRRSSGSRKF